MLILWQATVRFFNVPFVIFPAPTDIWSKLIVSLPMLYADFVQTFIRAVIPGWIIGSASGFLVALLCDRFAFLRQGLLPLGNLAAALPIVGVAPILVMWFGFDWQSKAAMVVVMTFFPMLVNAVAGLQASGHLERDLMRSYGASWFQTLIKLRLPAAMPFIFNALKINSTLAMIGAIVAEFFGTPIVGMGFRISTEVGRMGLDMVWAEIAVAALVGSAFYGLLVANRALGDFLASVLPEVSGNLERRRRTGKMKKYLLAAAAAGALLASSAGAFAEAVKLQLKWVTQAQFAGYYVAQAKGYYKDAGLEVTIMPGGPDINPQQVLAGGGADVVIDWMPSALATREKGSPVVNIAQPFKKSGMMLTCRKDTGITKPEDFKGKTLGVWFFGNEYPFLSWMSQLGLPTAGGADGVTVLKQGFNVDPLLQKQADCISTMTYNEYYQLIEAGMKAEDLVVFKYEDQGVPRWKTGFTFWKTS